MKDINCAQVIEKLYYILDRELEASDLAELERHVEKCQECLRRLQLEREFKELVRTRCSQEQLPAVLVERVKLVLWQEFGPRA